MALKKWQLKIVKEWKKIMPRLRKYSDEEAWRKIINAKKRIDEDIKKDNN